MMVCVALSSPAQKKKSDRNAYDQDGKKVHREFVVNQYNVYGKQYYYTEKLGGHDVRITPLRDGNAFIVSIYNLGYSDNCSFTLSDKLGHKLMAIPARMESTQISIDSCPEGTYSLSIKVNGKTSNWTVIKN